MRWMKAYLKRHCLGIFLYIIFALIVTVVFYLYHLSVEPVVYAMGLCIIIAIIVLVVDGWKYYKKAEKLERQLEAVKNGVEKLPQPEDEIEYLYQKLLENSKEERIQQVAKIMKEKAEITDYFTLWTHQIKTPIAAMRLLLQQEMIEFEQYYEQKKETESELFKIEQYVEMVLQYLRLNSNINDFVLREYELDSIICQAVRKYAPMFIRKKLILHYQPLQVKVVTDEKWLVFVLEQILSNAIKYTASGQVSIYIEGSCLVVEDTGIGILAEDLPRIFDKGYTGYNGRSDKKASGIGLYLVKKILNKLGHKILVESETGKGTKVKLLF
ncbi:MAG: sensor histidine kinase [Lachnospiraceae bacterium]